MTSTLALVDGIYDADAGYGTVIVREPNGPLTASGIPVKPPKQWFENPNLKGVSPLTITADGRVSGHIAAWSTSHIGMAGGIKPPKSKSNYAFFRTGVVETSEGEFVDVGQITLAGGHASLEASAKGAVAHYDDTQSAVMDVAAGEDRYGIWVAGALRPDVDDIKIRTIRASSVSGDWRPINGRLELVAVCAVNCPGFPIPRARVASGAPIALVAAGVEPVVQAAMRQQAQIDVEAGITAGLTIFRERVRNLEALVATTQIEQLRERVKPTPPDPVTAAADLRKRVKAPQVAALRARVRGSDAVPFGGSGDAVTAGSTFQRLFNAGMRVWDEALHPRGKDGRFIDKGGSVDGLFNLDIDHPDKKPSMLKRVKVVGFVQNDADPDDPYVVVENKLGNRGYGLSSNVTQVAAPKASLAGEEWMPENQRTLPISEQSDATLREAGTEEALAELDRRSASTAKAIEKVKQTLGGDDALGMGPGGPDDDEIPQWRWDELNRLAGELDKVMARRKVAGPGWKKRFPEDDSWTAEFLDNTVFRKATITPTLLGEYDINVQGGKVIYGTDDPKKAIAAAEREMARIVGWKFWDPKERAARGLDDDDALGMAPDSFESNLPEGEFAISEGLSNLGEPGGSMGRTTQGGERYQWEREGDSWTVKVAREDGQPRASGNVFLDPEAGSNEWHDAENPWVVDLRSYGDKGDGTPWLSFGGRYPSEQAALDDAKYRMELFGLAEDGDRAAEFDMNWRDGGRLDRPGQTWGFNMASNLTMLTKNNGALILHPDGGGFKKDEFLSLEDARVAMSDPSWQIGSKGAIWPSLLIEKPGAEVTFSEAGYTGRKWKNEDGTFGYEVTGPDGYSDSINSIEYEHQANDLSLGGVYDHIRYGMLNTTADYTSSEVWRIYEALGEAPFSDDPPMYTAEDMNSLSDDIDWPEFAARAERLAGQRYDRTLTPANRALLLEEWNKRQRMTASAALRAKVHGEAFVAAAALRERVHGGDDAVPFSLRAGVFARS